MGTVHRESGFTFHIWPEDHEPPHVHVWKAGAEVVVLLDPVSVREVERMKPKDVAQGRVDRGYASDEDAEVLEGDS